MKKILGLVSVVALCMGFAVRAGEGCCPSTAAAAGKEMHDCCKKTCEEVKAHPGTVKECCKEFCASHKDEKTGKVEMACHIAHKCCAEHFAKTGNKNCPSCANPAGKLGTAKH